MFLLIKHLILLKLCTSKIGKQRINTKITIGKIIGNNKPIRMLNTQLKNTSSSICFFKKAYAIPVIVNTNIK
jgi:hypothetical protein